MIDWIVKVRLNDILDVLRYSVYPYPRRLGFRNQICKQCGVYHTQAHRCGGGSEVPAVEYVLSLCEPSPIRRR